MSTTARRIRWLIPAVLIVAWLAVGGMLGPYAGKLGEVATNDQASFLPRSAESTKVIDAQKAFRQGGTLPAIVVWTSDDAGGRLSQEQQGAATRALATLTDSAGVAGEVSPAIPSRDGQALQGVVQLEPGLGEELPGALERVTAAAEAVPGTTVQLAGPAASQADLSDAFAGIDGLLLGVALVTVLLILLLVYRSVLLPLVIIAGAVFSLGLACAVVYVLADHDAVRVDGQVQGILSILVIGAATDYALLLTARFREELAAGTDRITAMRAALRQSFGPITASAATVALGLLALLLSDLTNNRALGPVGASGIACAGTERPDVPARRPGRPRPRRLLAGEAPARRGQERRSRHLDADRGPGGPRAAQGVGGHPRGPARLRRLRSDPERQGRAPGRDLRQRRPVRRRPGDAGQALPRRVREPGRRHRRRRGPPAGDGRRRRHRGCGLGRSGDGLRAAGSGEPLVVDGRVRIDAVLADAADTEAAKETVERLRSAVRAVRGLRRPGRRLHRPAVRHPAHGGARPLPHRAGGARDHPGHPGRPAAPLLMPVLLVATVALNFLATLGVSALVFQQLLGFGGTDSSVPLYGFVFLVALGVDYNIFLMSRVREESLRHGTREGVLRGLTATGGVITSAGVVLAATFAALGVIPLAFLLQIAFIVAFGVLLDTLVVRSLLVPALVRDIGRTSWWPGALSRRPD